MIDWGLVAKIAGGGFGSTLLVLVILTIVIWLIGFVMRRRGRKANDESK
jgi:Na+-transporting methylmalonyl-CoA/oxaloacetate decarboxylase gamma subunit